VVELDEYWEPPEIDYPDAFLLSKTADPHGFLKEDVKEQIKARRHTIEKMKSNRAQLFATIWGQLSAESEEKVRQVNNWDEIDQQKDPLLLLKAIKDIHLAAESGFNTKDRQKTRLLYSNLQQNNQETLLSFKEQFDHAIDAMEAVGQNVPSNEDQAIDFLTKLDNSRYAALKVQLENNQIMGLGKYPATLADAYKLASTYKFVVARDNPALPANQTVFIVSEESGAAQNPPTDVELKNKKKKSAKYSKMPEEATDETDTDGGRKKKYYPCDLCSKMGHPLFRCPLLQEAKEYMQQKQDEKENLVAMTYFGARGLDPDSVVL